MLNRISENIFSRVDNVKVTRRSGKTSHKIVEKPDDFNADKPNHLVVQFENKDLRNNVKLMINVRKS